MRFDSEQQKRNLMAMLKPQLEQAQAVLEICQAVNDGEVKPKKKGKKNEKL